MANAFAGRMKDLRRQKGLTQKQAAAGLGISQALLSHYEKGVRECGLDFLLRAAAFYGVTVDDLLEGDDRQTGFGADQKEKATRLTASVRALLTMCKEQPDLQAVVSEYLQLCVDDVYAGLTRQSVSQLVQRQQAMASLRLQLQPVDAETLAETDDSDGVLLQELIQQTRNRMQKE